MTPSPHFDLKMCNHAVEAYFHITDECPNILKNAAFARTAITAEVNQFKPLAANDKAYAGMVEQRMTALQAITVLTAPATAAEKVADKLGEALSNLMKHPNDKKAMDGFVTRLKEAQANCQQLRAAADKFQGDFMLAFGGGEPRKSAFVLYLKKLHLALTQETSNVRPPRPVMGPPLVAKH